MPQSTLTAAISFFHRVFIDLEFSIVTARMLIVLKNVWKMVHREVHACTMAIELPNCFACIVTDATMAGTRGHAVCTKIDRT